MMDTPVNSMPPIAAALSSHPWTTQIADGVWHLATGLREPSALRSAMMRLCRQLHASVVGRGATPIDRLIPRAAIEAPLHSLSGRFGKCSFPLHTDLAHWPVPPSFLMLAAERASQSSAVTTFARIPVLSDREFEQVSAGIFTISNSSKSFLGSICERGRSFFRFDPVCMKPIDDVSVEALRVFSASVNGRSLQGTVQWATGDIVVVNNWTVLHGRSSVGASDDRALLRLYFQEEQ